MNTAHTSTSTPAITITHMPNDIIIHILSCLPILNMIRIRRTCKLLNECSHHGGAWRHCLNKIDEEKRYNASNWQTFREDQEVPLTATLKRRILTESILHIKPKPLLHFLNTMRTSRDPLDDDLVCQLLEYYGSTLKRVRVMWPESDPAGIYGDRYSSAISDMKNLEYLTIQASSYMRSNHLKQSHMSTICRFSAITHLKLCNFYADKLLSLIQPLQQMTSLRSLSLDTLCNVDQLVMDHVMTKLTSLAAVDIPVHVGRYSDLLSPVDFSSMIAAKHLNSIQLDIQCREFVETETGWLNSHNRRMISQLYMVGNLHSVTFYLITPGDGKDDEGTISMFNALLNIPTKELHVKLCTHLREPTDQVNISIPSANAVIKSMKVTLLRDQSSRCRRDMLRSISTLPYIESLECAVFREECRDDLVSFTNQEMEEHFMRMRQQMQLPFCTVIKTLTASTPLSLSRSR